MQNSKKQAYSKPTIERIELDNDIDLQLESTPPVGPGGETTMNMPEYFNNDPFKTMG